MPSRRRTVPITLDAVPKTCESCGDWKERTEPTDQVRWGTCHEAPPRWYSDAEEARCDFAQTPPDECCRRWRPKQ